MAQLVDVMRKYMEVVKAANTWKNYEKESTLLDAEKKGTCSMISRPLDDCFARDKKLFIKACNAKQINGTVVAKGKKGNEIFMYVQLQLDGGDELFFSDKDEVKFKCTQAKWIEGTLRKKKIEDQDLSWESLQLDTHPKPNLAEQKKREDENADEYVIETSEQIFLASVSDGHKVTIQDINLFNEIEGTIVRYVKNIEKNSVKTFVVNIDHREDSFTFPFYTDLRKPVQLRATELKWMKGEVTAEANKITNPIKIVISSASEMDLPVSVNDAIEIQECRAPAKKKRNC